MSKRDNLLSFLCVALAACLVWVCLGASIRGTKICDLEIERDIYASRAQNWQELAQELESEPPAVIEQESVIQALYVGDYMCTAYCCEEYAHICGTGDGITASGQPIQAGVTAAACNAFPFGTVLYIEGVGIRIVQDRGGAIDGERLDIAVDTHENALAWSGYGMHKVYVLEWGRNYAAD